MQQTIRARLLPVVILGGLFALFGFVTWLNGILIPYLKIACELTYFQSLLVAFAFYIAYFVMALPSAWVLKRTGFKQGMMIGLVIMALGALLFVPAAQTRTYGIFLLGLFVIATGLALLQTAANPYVTVIGPIESAAKRISIMGICNKVAGVLAPLVLARFILYDADTIELQLAMLRGAELEAFLDDLAARAILPYALFSLVPLSFALLLSRVHLPEVVAEEPIGTSGRARDRSGPLAYPHLLLGVLALFLYVGAEVIAGDTIIPYGLAQGMPLAQAQFLTSLTLGAMVLGYIIGIITIPKFISQSKALMLSAIVGVLFSLVAIMTSGYISVLFIALLGFANALVWPAIWPLAIAGLGQHTKTGSALLIMAIAGGALLPLVYGHFADMPAVGPQQAYWVLIPCYLFILWYSVKGARISRW